MTEAEETLLKALTDSIVFGPDPARRDAALCAGETQAGIRGRR